MYWRICINIVSLAAQLLSFGTVIRSLYLNKNFQVRSAGYFIVKNYLEFFISSLLIIQLSEYIYYELAENLIMKGIIKILFASGFSLTTILICSGRLIDVFYKRCRDKKYVLLQNKMPKNFPPINVVEKTYIICWSCIASIITSFNFHYLISVYAIAIFLGRFFWFDSIIGSTFPLFFNGIFKPMDGSDLKINGSIIRIKNMVLVGSLVYVIVYAVLKKAFGFRIGKF